MLLFVLQYIYTQVATIVVDYHWSHSKEVVNNAETTDTCMKYIYYILRLFRLPVFEVTVTY